MTANLGLKHRTECDLWNSPIYVLGGLQYDQVIERRAKATTVLHHGKRFLSFGRPMNYVAVTQPVSLSDPIGSTTFVVQKESCCFCIIQAFPF